MRFNHYLGQLSSNQKRRFYARAGLSGRYFSKLKAGHRRPSNQLLTRLIAATEGQCTVYDVARFFEDIVMANQRDQLLKLMKKRWISPLEALEEVGCLRLAARVHEIRLSGVTIEDQMVSDGKTHYKKYRVRRLNHGRP